MRRLAAAVLAVVLLAAAGCGTSPEDKANDAGKDIGEELYSLRTATDASMAQTAVSQIQEELTTLRSELSPSARERLQGIGQDLRDSLADADSPSARAQAFANALAQVEALRSDSDSVINEFIDGVREGYADAD